MSASSWTMCDPPGAKKVSREVTSTLRAHPHWLHWEALKVNQHWELKTKQKKKYDITELVNILQPVLVKWPTRHSQPQSLLLKSYHNDGGFTCALFQKLYLEKCIFLIHVYITALMWGLSYAWWFDNYFLIFLGTYLEIRKELREIHTVLLHNCI